LSSGEWSNFKRAEYFITQCLQQLFRGLAGLRSALNCRFKVVVAILKWINSINSIFKV